VPRLEYRDRITVTTVYPGHIRSRAALEGAVPAERVDAARTRVRAALGPPVREIATRARLRRLARHGRDARSG
jgi:hypothetical protein